MTVHRAPAGLHSSACGDDFLACSPPGSAGVDTLRSQTAGSSAAPSVVAEDLFADMAVGMFTGYRSAPLLPAEVASLRACAQDAFSAAYREATTAPNAFASRFGELDDAPRVQNDTEGIRQAAQAALAACFKEVSVVDSGRVSAELVAAHARVSELEEQHRLDLETIVSLTAKQKEMMMNARRKEAEIRESFAADMSELKVLRTRPANADSDARLATLELDLADARRELGEKTAELAQKTADAEVAQKAAETPRRGRVAAKAEEDSPLLTAAYQQISALNTQLAHMYTELTMARTETATQAAESFDSNGAAAVADVQKQNQQIADLVSDIRHLQLDLEYHQHKLDEMLEEKQQMMRDKNRAEQDLVESRKQLEETTQMLQHSKVDLDRLKGQLQSPSARARAGVAADDGGDGDRALMESLRKEASAKDSALVCSHYELHKERLLRDRLEQKNTKLMERMQKLMMVVETMRKDNVSLERALAGQERAREEGELHLRQMKQKARQLQKLAKAPKGSKARSGSSSSRSLSRSGSAKALGQKLELQDSPPRVLAQYQQAQYQQMMGVPPQRSIDYQSGVSTPRQAVQSARGPYGTR